MDNLLYQALSVLNFAIFRRHEKEKFFLLYASQPWFQQCIPGVGNNSYLSIAGISHFLDNFLIEAECLWSECKEEQVQSEVWVETLQDSPLTLQALAYYKENVCYLMIKDAENHYLQRQQTLQTARESMLEHQQILDSHFIAQNRLEKLLNQAKSRSQHTISLLRALEHVDLGIIVTDMEQRILLQNPATYRLFSVGESASHDEPLIVLHRLFESQLPEFEQLLDSGRRWDGELYCSDVLGNGKWLQVSFFSIKNTVGKIDSFVYLISDTTKVKHLIENNERLYRLDILTNLPNRHSLFAFIEGRLKTQSSLTLTCINIKQFHHINKQWGYGKGDQLLCSFADWLKSNFDQALYIARISGDEFLLVDSPKSPEEIISSCHEHPWQIDSHSIDLKVSVSEVKSPQHGDTVEVLMKNIDLAMHLARQHFDSCFQAFTEQVKSSADLILFVAKRLPMALDSEQFELYLQPIINVQTGKIIQAETLIRWNSSERGLIMPDDFISVAEQTGAIVPIGNWVISKTCDLASHLKNQGIDIKLSFNVSPVQLNSDDLLEHLEFEVTRHQLTSNQLEIEVTENVMLENLEKFRMLFNRAHELGITVSIDDFGTGYSSLSYLAKFPVDKLKIDRSFIIDILSSHANQSIVEAIISLAGSLKLDIVAEGVETKQQSEFLAQKQCNFLQGYYYAKPLTFVKFCEYMKVEGK